jgi:hypothetical protein
MLRGLRFDALLMWLTNKKRQRILLESKMNPIRLRTHKAVDLLSIAAIALLALSLNACAKEDVKLQPVKSEPVKLLSDAEIEAKYRTCPSGYYSGPQPGKARYAHDPFMWVVTPEFAKRLCLPQAFISTELKGAEAVAFRILNKGDGADCGFGGNPNNCVGEKVLRFEIYIKSDVKLPRLREGRTYQRINMPSSMLLSMSDAERLKEREMIKRDPVPASIPHFTNNVGLVGFKDGKVAWQIVNLYQEAHRGGTFDGIDYYAFEGSTGFFGNERMEKLCVKQFFITFEKISEAELRHGSTASAFSHLIELPTAYTDKIAQLDRQVGHRFTGSRPNPSRPEPSCAK